mmetsp:Transcript_133615/g.415527  ORF Transcript_133615/g.415527 Transcript_133615/m.415527 type:complete len:98 (-) Transcript_133615:68-361(-)
MVRLPHGQGGQCHRACTRVTRQTAPLLCASMPTSAAWREVLELICDLVEERGPAAVLPEIDHGRVSFFLGFWREVEESPPWMRAVCDRLAHFRWHQC